MGSRMAVFPKAAARRMARSWVLKRSRRVRHRRMARRPRAGFSSFSKGRQGACLSAPRSRVRITVRFPAMASTTWR